MGIFNSVLTTHTDLTTAQESCSGLQINNIPLNHYRMLCTKFLDAQLRHVVFKLTNVLAISTDFYLLLIQVS